MWNPVRRHQSVHTEISVMKLFPKVSAIKKACFGFYCMIAPFPDKAAAHSIISVDQFKIILQVSRSVSHSVRIFAHHKGKIFRKRTAFRLFKIGIVNGFEAFYDFTEMTVAVGIYVFVALQHLIQI